MSVYAWLADLVVAGHLAYVVFVIGGLALIVLGILLRWQWIRNFYFRAIHLMMIGVVVAETALEIVCPLTDWEDRLRAAAGEEVEAGTFIGRWADRLLFGLVPWEILPVAYWVFFLLVVAALVLAPPRRPPWLRRTRP